jgi:hypothetical protein
METGFSVRLSSQSRRMPAHCCFGRQPTTWNLSQLIAPRLLRPFAGILRRNDDTPAHNFGSVDADAVRTLRRMPRTPPRTNDRAVLRKCFRAPYRRPPGGISRRSPCQGGCTRPSSSRHFLADKRASSNRTHRHIARTLRCTIDSVQGSWSWSKLLSGNGDCPLSGSPLQGCIGLRAWRSPAFCPTNLGPAGAPHDAPAAARSRHSPSDEAAALASFAKSGLQSVGIAWRPFSRPESLHEGALLRCLA